MPCCLLSLSISTRVTEHQTKINMWKEKKLAEEDDAASTDSLEKYQVEIIPPPPFSERLRNRFNASYFRSVVDFCKARGCIIGIMIILEIGFVLFNYYYSYQSVYPGSKVAANINRTRSSGTAFEVFKWMICSASVALTGSLAVLLLIFGARLVDKIFPRWVIVPFATFWVPLCVFLGTWQVWISFLLVPVWTDHVYSTACHGWDMSANLQGVSWDNQFKSLPHVGTAMVVLAHGNYSMHLERDEIDHDVYYFYPADTFNYTPPFSNITYNFANAIYTIDNVTTHFTLKPNLQFPSLDLVLHDMSIPFESTYGPPNADLVYHNGSIQTNVFNTVTTKANDCTQLRACGMLNPNGAFDIAMGVVMIQQYSYSISCTTPSNNSCS